MRLLSLLQLVEDSVVQRAPRLMTAPVRRQANYGEGRARMLCGDGSSLLLHAFPLADGQLCIKAIGYDAKAEPVLEHVIYASAPGFEWNQAAEALAEAWLTALAARAAPVTRVTSADEEATDAGSEASSDELAAAG